MSDETVLRPLAVTDDIRRHAADAGNGHAVHPDLGRWAADEIDHLRARLAEVELARGEGKR